MRGEDRSSDASHAAAIPLRVLVVEDSEDDAQLILRELRRGGYAPQSERVYTAAALTEILIEREWDVITCDYVMPGFGGLAALDIVREHDLDVPVIVVSGEVGEEIAATVMRSGAHDFVSKHRLDRLISAVARELRETAERRRRRQAEDAVRTSHADLQAVLNNSLQSFVLVDRNARIRSFNQIASVRTQLLAMSGRLAVGQSIYDFAPPSARATTEREFARALGGELVTLERSMRNGAGTPYWFEVSYVPIRDDADTVTGVCISALDVTDRRRADEALRSGAERDRVLVTLAVEWMWEIDRQGVVTYSNPAVEPILGYRPAEVVGSNSLALIHHADRDPLERALSSPPTPPVGWRGRIARWRCKDGSYGSLEGDATPILNQSGGLVGYRGADHEVPSRSD